MRLVIEFEWRDAGAVGLDANGKLAFPKLPQAPGIYAFHLAGDSESQYIGESDNLQRRVGQYRNPGPSQATNIRLNKRLREHLQRNGAITMRVVTNGRLAAGDTPPRALDLALKHTRRLLENCALATVPAACALENA